MTLQQLYQNKHQGNVAARKKTLSTLRLWTLSPVHYPYSVGSVSHFKQVKRHSTRKREQTYCRACVSCSGSLRRSSVRSRSPPRCGAAQNKQGTREMPSSLLTETFWNCAQEDFLACVYCFSAQIQSPNREVPKSELKHVKIGQ